MTIDPIDPIDPIWDWLEPGERLVSIDALRAMEAPIGGPIHITMNITNEEFLRSWRLLLAEHQKKKGGDVSDGA